MNYRYGIRDIFPQKTTSLSPIDMPRKGLIFCDIDGFILIIYPQCIHHWW
jgi:hypothetical protein